MHQFDKVEMFAFVSRANPPPSTQRILAVEESILTELEIPYRVVAIAIGDSASAGDEVGLRGMAPGSGAATAS